MRSGRAAAAPFPPSTGLGSGSRVVPPGGLSSWRRRTPVGRLVVYPHADDDRLAAWQPPPELRRDARKHSDRFDRDEQAAGQPHVGRGRPGRRRIGHVPGVDLVEAAEVLDVGGCPNGDFAELTRRARLVPGSVPAGESAALKSAVRHLVFGPATETANACTAVGFGGTTRIGPGGLEQPTLALSCVGAGRPRSVLDLSPTRTRRRERLVHDVPPHQQLASTRGRIPPTRSSRGPLSSGPQSFSGALPFPFDDTSTSQSLGRRGEVLNQVGVETAANRSKHHSRGKQECSLEPRANNRQPSVASRGFSALQRERRSSAPATSEPRGALDPRMWIARRALVGSCGGCRATSA